MNISADLQSMFPWNKKQAKTTISFTRRRDKFNADKLVIKASHSNIQKPSVDLIVEKRTYLKKLIEDKRTQLTLMEDRIRDLKLQTNMLKEPKLIIHVDSSLRGLHGGHELLGGTGAHILTDHGDDVGTIQWPSRFIDTETLEVEVFLNLLLICKELSPIRNIFFKSDSENNVKILKGLSRVRKERQECYKSMMAAASHCFREMTDEEYRITFEKVLKTKNRVAHNMAKQAAIGDQLLFTHYKDYWRYNKHIQEHIQNELARYRPTVS